MYYNEGEHLDQTKTPAVTVQSGLAVCYVGQGVAALVRRCVSGFRRYFAVDFRKLF